VVQLTTLDSYDAFAFQESQTTVYQNNVKVGPSPWNPLSFGSCS